jgi:hypothetical protein
MSSIVQAATDAIDSIRINVMSREERDGRVFWVKQRRSWSPPIIKCANAFFLAVGNPVVVLSDPEEWQTWEIRSFLMLHQQEGYTAFSDAFQRVYAEQVPGVSLEDSSNSGTLIMPMVKASGAELYRAHQLQSDLLKGSRWSHGDPHLGNFLFDEVTQRARLIDFEVAHDPTLPEIERHADDVLVFLQDLMGRVAFDDWLPMATCFLSSYGDTDVIRVLEKRLQVPRGVSRIWWAIRTSYLKATERNRRIAMLRDALKSF